MIIYLCSDAMDLINQSGVGRAIEHQQMALKSAGIPYTLTDEKTHDVIHINTVFPSSYIRAKRAKKMGSPLFIMPIQRKMILKILFSSQMRWLL